MTDMGRRVRELDMALAWQSRSERRRIMAEALREIEAETREACAKVAEARAALYRTGARVSYEQGDVDEAETRLPQAQACQDVAAAIRSLKDA